MFKGCREILFLVDKKETTPIVYKTTPSRNLFILVCQFATFSHLLCSQTFLSMTSLCNDRCQNLCSNYHFIIIYLVIQLTNHSTTLAMYGKQEKKIQRSNFIVQFMVETWELSFPILLWFVFFFYIYIFLILKRLAWVSTLPICAG